MAKKNSAPKQLRKCPYCDSDIAEAQFPYCDACGFKARQFFWRCPACGGWETFPPRRLEEHTP